MARISVVQCDRCFIRVEAGPQSLPEGWTVLAGPMVRTSFESLVLCGECAQAFVQFMGEIEKAAKPEEPGSKVE